MADQKEPEIGPSSIARKHWWVIRIGGGYGEFIVHETEQGAEARRVAKARWEGAPGHKFRCDSEVCAKVLIVLLERGSAKKAQEGEADA